MIKKINKIAIANRGEIAVRIIRGAQELGIKTVLLHSDVDRDSMAYRMSDEQVCIGSFEARQSYLHLDSVFEGVVSSKAQAVHPGVGFLSESADLARAFEKKGIFFVGPNSDFLSLFSNKKALCDEVKQLGIPTLPSFIIEKENLFIVLDFKAKEGNLSLDGKNKKHQKIEKALNQIYSKASEIGYPLMVKTNEGGGGRGLRKVYHKKDLIDAIESAFKEGKNSFQSENLFLEKYLDEARHIEAQIFVGADGSFFHLGTRDCTVQRRFQKLIEEAPASYLSFQVEEKIRNATLKFMKRFESYRGAGTLEFLVQGDQYYFIEMNPRLQVEHPVTEIIEGVDIVKAQILTAQNKPLLWNQKEFKKEFKSSNRPLYAIECRILAEDYDKFLRDGSIWPSTGKLGSVYWPLGPGRRFDVGFEKDDEITHFYDSLIGKVIVWDESRIRAIQKMRKTLSDTILFGVKTNISFLMSLLAHPDYVSGKMSTDFISNLIFDIPSSKNKNRNQKDEFPRSFSKPLLFYKGQEDLNKEDLKLAEKVYSYFKSFESKTKKDFKKISSSSSAESYKNPWMESWT